jgi:tRNA threonylcarbamoyladenosine biosynthesis protein TsaB
VIPAIGRLLEWTGIELGQVGGVAVGIGPGLYTGLRVGVEAAKTFAQALRIPIVGVSSLDVLAFAVRTTRRRIGAVLDARRGEVFFAFYRSVHGGLMRELEADPEEVLLVGNGAMLYQRTFEETGVQVGFAPVALAHPWASALVELSAARFIREETDRATDVVPMYLRKTDAEIGWDRRARGASA